MKTADITTIAGARLIAEVDRFVKHHRPLWSREALARTAGVDRQFLLRVQRGEPFSTRIGDRLQQCMRDIRAGRITAPPPPLTRRQVDGTRKRARIRPSRASHEKPEGRADA